MKFDFEAARSAGYSDDEIADYLAKENNFDLGGALKSGYTSSDVISYLIAAPEPKAETAPEVKAEPKQERGIFDRIKDTALNALPAAKMLSIAAKVPTEAGKAAAAPEQPKREPVPYKNRTEALDDAVNLLEEGAPKKDVADAFAKGGISFDEITQHGIKRGSEYFKQQPASVAKPAQTPVEPQPSGEIKAWEPTAFEEIGNTIKRGVLQARKETDTLKFQTGVIDSGTYAERTRETERRLGAAAPSGDVVAGLERLQKANESGSYIDVAKELLRPSNFKATVALIAESAIPSLANLPYTVAGGAVGGPAGMAVAAGATSFASEYANALDATLEKRGVDKSDAMAVRSAIENPEVIAEARDYGIKRGIPVAAFDAISAGFAGRFVRTLERAVEATGKAATKGAISVAVGKEAALQIGSGMAGEVGGQIATGENKPLDVLVEGLAELPSGVVEVATNVATAGRARPSTPEIPTAEQMARDRGFLAQPAQVVNFTEPDSATAQAGLTPIVVPIPAAPVAPAADLEAVTLPEIDQTTEQEFGLDTLRTGGVNVSTGGTTQTQPTGGGVVGGDQRGGSVGVSGPAVDVATGQFGGGARLPAANDGQTVAVGSAAAQPATNLARPFERASNEDLLARTEAAIVEQQNNNANTQPTEQWVGRKGDGYTTQADAAQALGGRQRMFPNLDWKIEQMPSGKFRLAGYSTETTNGTQAPQAVQAEAQGQEAPVTSARQLSDLEQRQSPLPDTVFAGLSANPQSADIRGRTQSYLDSLVTTGRLPEVPQLGTPDVDAEGTINALGNLFGAATGLGNRVVAYSQPNGDNGFALSGIAFVNTSMDSSSVDAPRTTWHELRHVAEQLAKAGNKAAQEFTAQMDSIFDDMTDEGKRAYIENFMFKSEIAGITDPAAREARINEILQSPSLRSEMVADFLGNRSQDRAFLIDLAKADPQGFEGFVRKWLAVIDNLIAKLRGGKTQGQKESAKVDQYIRDLNKAKMVARDALIAFRKGNLAAQSQTTQAVEAEAEMAMSARQVEQVGDFKVRTMKDGTAVVYGEPDAIRAQLPEDVKGRVTKDGIVFTTAAAARVKAALGGRSTAYSREGAVLDKLPMRNGKYLGAPAKFDTPAKIPTLRKILRQLADEGAPGRYWYENSGREVLKMVGGDVQEARKFVALLAIYSPQAKVDANSTFALRAWAQYKAGQSISVKTGVMDTKAKNALDDVEAFWSGEKTGNFFFNLLREIDPSTKGKQGATIDMWMMRAGQYDTDAPTSTQYAFMENETNRLAAELGWEPQQVQAAIWVAMKARMENKDVKKMTEASSEKKGWIRYDYPIKNGKPFKTRVIINEQKHRDNWLKYSFAHDVTKDDTQQAKFDFGDGLKRHIGQVSFEARPGRTTNVLPRIHSAPYAQQVEFQQAVQKAFLDDQGNDLLAMKLGLLVDNDILVPGVWQGEISPSTQLGVAMAPAKGDEGKTSVDPAQAKALNVYAAIAGLVARQEGVGWHRPFYSSTKRDANGLDIDVGRPLNPREVADLEQAVGQWMTDNGHDGWQNQFAFISSPNGIRLVNFGIITNEKLHSDILDVAGTVLPDAKAQWFASSGDMMTNDWKENQNGQDYVNRASAEGRSDVLDWARAYLAPRVQQVFDDFSKRYDWGDAGELNFSRRDRGRGQGVGGTQDRQVQAPERATAQEVISANEPLLGAPRIQGFTGPDPRLVAVAEQYARDNGITLRRQAEYVQVDPERAARIAQAYEDMPHSPNDLRVKAAYKELIKQTVAQYRALEKAGYKFWFMDMSKPDNQEYASSPWNAMRDIRANQTMGVFPTDDGFGSSDFDPTSNPLLEDTGIKWPSGSLTGPRKRVLANDLFRAVHDAFGHGLEGAGFRAQGEENAWQAHVRLFKGKAVAAITSETRGQNSWLNYGPHGESNRTAKVEDTVFADQKTGLMPEWTWTEGVVGDMPAFSARQPSGGAAAEFEITKARFMGADQWMKAPNGKPTNLTERQWVQVRTPSFKAWFGDWEKHASAANPVGSLWSDDNVSKVVDENGEPLVVYHGSNKAGFSVFNRPGGTGRGDLGIFATPNLEMAKTYMTRRAGEIQIENDPLRPRQPSRQERTQGYYSSFMNIRKPLESDFEGATWNGERPGQYQVMADDELQYTPEGKAYFDNFDDANEFAKTVDGEVLPAFEHYETTDAVVAEARKYDDGAIIRNVVDDGGGVQNMYVGEPSDVYVAFEPNQIKSATQNTGEFSSENDDIRYSKRDKPQFYSQLERSIATVPDRLATQPAPQWKAWLASNAPKLGIKKDEIEWSGINDYLDLRGKDKVTKADIAAYLKDSGVRVNTLEITGPQIDNEPEIIEEDDGSYRIYSEDGTLVDKTYYDTEDEAQEAVDALKSDSTQYGEYSLHGGTNYREVLLTLPAMGQADTERMMQLEAKRRRLSQSAQWVFDDDAEGKELKALQAKVKADTFQSNHFDVKNIVAHIRANDREIVTGGPYKVTVRERGTAGRRGSSTKMFDTMEQAQQFMDVKNSGGYITELEATGKAKVLFIEEVQSDWGQGAKKRGFKGNVDEAKAALKKFTDDMVAKYGIDGMAAGKDTPEEQAEFARLSNALSTAKNGLPRAPFVTKTEGWLNLALKRIAMMAVEGGYDKVAFVNGQQSADRYDLSKQIDSIGYDPQTRRLEAYDKNRKSVMNRTGVAEDQLEDYVGKEVAKRLLEQPLVMGKHLLEGENIKVGGEGMVKFYDEIVPQALNKLLPKLGGDKLGDVEINSTQQPSFDVTDKMRDTVGAGVPMFSKRNKQTSVAPQVAATKEAPKRNVQKRQRLVGANFEMDQSSKVDTARIKLQDDALRMKRVIEAVKAKGGKVGEAQNFYDANTLMSGRIQAATDDFKNEIVKPMLDKAVEFKIDLDELAMYAYAKHARERNAHIASINKRMPDGGSGMTNDEADTIIQMVELAGDKEKFEELHKMLMGITSATRQLMLSEGLITEEEFNQIDGAYEDYIPLRGFEDVDEETGTARMGVGRGINIRGAETIRAMGRKSKAGDLIENVIRDYEKVIARVEKNDVGKVLLDFVLSNPDPELWGVDIERTKPTFNKAKGVVQYTKSIEKGEDTIGVKVGGQQVYIKLADKELTRALRNAWKDETSGLERVIVATTGWWNNWMRNVLTKYNPAFAAINIPRDALWSGTSAALDELGPQGLARYIKAYGKALMASTRQELGVSGTTSIFGNPEVDALFKEFRAAGGITGGFYMRSLEDINKDLRGELLLSGAAPRGTFEKIQSLPPYKLAKLTLRMLEFMGAASENATRFALFMAAKESGKSSAKAAVLAKDGTTNFNRKGEWGGALNNLYLFFNAAVQGNAQLIKVLKNPKVQASMAGVAGVGMMLAAYGASAGGEDDDGEKYWDKIPSYIKERNLVIMLPPGDGLAGGIERVGKRGRYLTIPVQYGFNIFPNIGYMLSDVVRNAEDPKRGVTPTKAALHMTSVVFGSVNPFGGSVDVTDGVQVLLAVAPTLADLPIQLANERGTFGTPSAPSKSPFDKRPDSERMFMSQQGTVPAKIAKAINELGGGNEAKAGSILGAETSVTPGTIDTLIRSTTGGLGSFIEQVGTAVVSMTGDDKNLKANKIPFLNKFYGEVDEDANIRSAGERMREVKKVVDEVKEQQRVGIDPEMKDEEQRLNSLAAMQESYQRAQSQMRKAEIEIIKDTKMTDAEKRLARQRIQVERDKLATDINREYLNTVKK